MARPSDRAQAKFSTPNLMPPGADMPGKSGGLPQRGPAAYPVPPTTSPKGPSAYPQVGSQKKAPVKGKRKGPKKGVVPPQFMPGYQKKGM